MRDKRLLDIRNLSVSYKTYRGFSHVLDDISMYVKPQEKVGIVGESGCGKTTSMKTVLRLQEDTNAVTKPGATILFNDQNVLEMNENELLALRRKKVSMISQSPMAALNPVFTIGQQMMDIVRYSGYYESSDKKQMKEAVLQAIRNVMIPDAERIFHSYPYQLSGGMRQRICIASSLVTPRDLLIADEPGTALDVTVQEQIHGLLKRLVDEDNRSLIMITHSLGVARELVDRIYVMYAGTVAETAYTSALFDKPMHPYTEGLFACVPRLSGTGISEGIYGYIPDYNNPPPGCRFASRCKYKMDVCDTEKPPLIEVEANHFVACYKYV